MKYFIVIFSLLLYLVVGSQQQCRLLNQTQSQFCGEVRQLQEILVDVNPLMGGKDQFQPTINQTSDKGISDADDDYIVFNIPSLSITRIEIDLRHLSNYTHQLNETYSEELFQYPLQWDIALIKGDQVVKSDFLSLPMSFQSNRTQKNNFYTFSLFAIEELKLMIKIVIYDSQFYSYKYEFMNITKITNQVANRAHYGDNKIFVFMMQDSNEASLPLNPLPLNQDQGYLSYLISYISSSDELQPNELIPSVNLFTPKSQYWGLRNNVLLPYIPYFSNCKGYGNYLYLFEIIEGPQCDLVDVDDTREIKPFQFGYVPYADSYILFWFTLFNRCNDIKFECVLDEPYNQNSQSSNWFELQKDDVLFNMLKDPVDSQEYLQMSDIPSTQQVEVPLKNAIPEGKMASDVKLTIQYYQITKTQKRIIEASIEFSNFYILTDAQIAGEEPIYYDLILNYQPMDQGQLVIAFALPTSVYFILYLGIGFLSIIEVCFFLLYHWIFNRKKPRPKIKFIAYVMAVFPAGIYGCFLALPPILIIHTFIAIIMKGKLFSHDLAYACDLIPPSDSDQGCPQVLFDIFKNDLKYEQSAFENLRAARCGISFIICGLYVMYVISELFLPPSQNTETESFDGNVQEQKQCSRGKILYMSMMISFLMVVLIQFSFTDAFGDSAWYFLMLLKILQMELEYFLEAYTENNIIVVPISCTMASMVNIATMGADDFYDFLFSYLIELGIMMIERAYVIKFEKDITGYLEMKYNVLVTRMKKLVDEDNEEQNEDEVLLDAKDATMTPAKDNSDSDIIFTDEYQENLVSEDESVQSLKQREGASQNFVEYENEEFEEKFRTSMVEWQKKQVNLQYENNDELLSEKENSFLDSQKDYSSIIEYFSSFAQDVATMLYQPFIIMFMWMFYSDSVWAENYDISEPDFIFFLIWAIIIIPFQMVIDVLFYNLVEQYHDYDFLSYLSIVSERFEKRKYFWKASLVESPFESDRNLVYLDCKKNSFLNSQLEWCFSSQFYFTITLYLSGMFLVILGTQTILWNDYDLFSDQALVFICVFWIMVCYMVQKLKLWHLKETPLATKTANNKAQIHPFNEAPSIEEILDSQQESIAEQEKLLVGNWESVLIHREREERLMEINKNLDREQFKSEQFRRQFVNANKIWLRDNIKQLLSPRTLNVQRKNILSQFQVIYGTLENKKEQDQVFEEIDKPVQAVSQNLKFKTKMKEVSKETQAVLKYWLFRKRHLKRVTQQVGGLIEKMTKQYCEYCGLNWGLRGECQTRIEDLHLMFLKERGIKQIRSGTEIDECKINNNVLVMQQQNKRFQSLQKAFMIEELLKDKLESEKQRNKLVQKGKKYTLYQIARYIMIWLKFYKLSTNYDSEYTD